MTEQRKARVSTSDLVVAYPGAFSPDQCREMIDRFETSAHQYESITAAGAKPGRRGAMVKMSSDPAWADLKTVVTEKTVACLHDYAARFEGIKFILKLENVFLSSPVIERYLETEGFNWHIDSGPRETATRFLSSLTYLNDVAEGGRTEFPMQGLEITPRAGTMVLFPPYWMFPHRAAPAHDVKYKMTAYFTIANGVARTRPAGAADENTA